MQKIAILALGAVLAVGYWSLFSAPDYKRVIGIPTPFKVWQWKQSLAGTQPFTISMITDTHVRSRSHVRGDYQNRFLTEKYTGPLADFAEGVAAHDPSFIVHLGDVIEGTDDAAVKGEANLHLVRAIIEALEKPAYWIIGNHDTRSITREQFLSALDIDYLNKSFDYGPYRFIIVDANYRANGEPAHPDYGDDVSGEVPTETFAWLEQELQTDKHAIVLMHYATVPQAVTGKSPVRNAGELRALFAQYNVSAVFNGHIERRYYEKTDGVEYFSLPGTKKSPLYPSAYYSVTFDRRGPHVTMHYRDPETREKVTEPFYREGQMLRQEKESLK